MEIAPTQYIVFFLIAVLGGFTAAALYTFAVVRYSRRLGYRVTDLEERLLTLGAKKAANARWDEKKWMEEAVKQTVPATKQRYDNDPME